MSYNCFRVGLYIAVFALILPTRSYGQDISVEPESATERARSEAALSTAQEQIERLNAALAIDLDAPPITDYQQRYTELFPVVRDVYDFPTMARLMVGRQAWRDFDAGQQSALTQAIEALSTAAYASRFNTLTDQHFSVNDAAPGPRGTIVVDTKIEPDQEDSVQIAYVMRENGDQWQIIDVFINEQYSEVARRRSDFSAVLRDQGLEGLLTRIDELVANYRDDFQPQPDG